MSCREADHAGIIPPMIPISRAAPNANATTNGVISSLKIISLKVKALNVPVVNP